MTDALLKLFGSSARLKVLRLFLFNQKSAFTVPEIAEHARLKERETRREIKLLASIKFIKRVRRPLRIRGTRYELNDEFVYTEALKKLLLNAPSRGSEFSDRIRSVGAIKLVILGGIFAGEWEGRLDLLIVGDRVNEKKLRERIKRFESEIGKELRYALLSSEDFYYRFNMNDHLVRDVLDYPHMIALDKINIALK